MVRKTNIFSLHEQLGGKVVDFAGWLLPVRYESAVQEHLAVRNSVGIFDVSHMGEILVEGENSEEFLNYVTCNDLRDVSDWKAQYSAILNENSGVVDDLIIYRYSRVKYFLCVNASNVDTVFNWLNQKNTFGVSILNVSEKYSQIAVQGKNAISLLNNSEINKLKYFEFCETEVFGIPAVVARTGYTGEDGVEIFIPWESGEALFKKLIELGAKPCGLAARDSLRLEACYPLHGHELGTELSAVDSGLSWIIKLKKEDFIGKDFISKYLGTQKLIAFEVVEPGIVRENTKLFSDGIEVGYVTSGTHTPTLNKSVGMAIIKNQFADVGTVLNAEVRGKFIQIKVVKKPLYKRV